MVKLHCAWCGDILRRTTLFRRGVTRAEVVDVQWRHTTRRWDNRYNPEVTTRPRIFRRNAARVGLSARGTGAMPVPRY
jgi:hypothetical protein